MVFSRNSQYSRIAIDPHRQTVGCLRLYWLLAFFLAGAYASSAHGQNDASIEWVKNPYIDFVGKDFEHLQFLELTSQSILEGCRLSLDWPHRFPNQLMVLVSNGSTPQVRRGGSGLVRLELPDSLGEEEQAIWITRGLLTHFGFYRGVQTPPPDWLVQAIRIRGALHVRPAAGILLRRELTSRPVPSIAECIENFDKARHSGWPMLIYQFLESGGLDKSVFQQRLVQYWANGYDWGQLSVFFEPRYPDLNPAELELLWKTFTAETLSSESSVCLSESDSLDSLERIGQLEIVEKNQPVVLTQDIWFLHREDSAALQAFGRKQSELEVLAVTIHPYYFNACHSLDQLLLAIENDDLEAFRSAARQYSQDMLDAQQLSFETDQLLRRLCPDTKLDLK